MEQRVKFSPKFPQTFSNFPERYYYQPPTRSICISPDLDLGSGSKKMREEGTPR